MPVERTVEVDGESVSAVHHPAEGDRWMVFCHGFLSDKTGSYERRAARAVEEGYDAVRFDFRGCGDSDGAFADSTLGSRLADLRAVLEAFDPDPCVLFGSSFGARVAVHAAVDDDRVDAVVGRAPVTYGRAFDDYRALVEEEGEIRVDDGRAIDRRFFEALDERPFAEVEAGLDVPVAMFHGRDDESVPLADTLRAAGELRGDVLVRAFPGEGHRFSEAAEARTLDATFDWLARR